MVDQLSLTLPAIRELHAEAYCHLLYVVCGRELLFTLSSTHVSVYPLAAFPQWN